ncbi:helicase-associated domain-containing protein [Actinotalea sp. K2]|uniref:helicase-associated domain-containing protein n=1 Tax=Actinotalea sp. K2 TaxID=2939438 RepID=UPI002016BA9B|nr:helicase-associated domain-containing protein [Actinotalea sp. K2]MCL3861528.1 helicase-associated domain-containing protein [Actinotalea sp. K2]
MATFTQSLRARGESGLVELLTLRPDLASPPPSSIRSLAARAANRVSLDRALAGLDAQALQVLEAALALDGTAAHPEGIAPHDIARAVGDAVDGRVADAVRTCVEHALLWHATDGDDLHPAPGLDDVLGPYPAGLGPRLSTTLARRSPQALARLAEGLGLAPTGAGTPDAGSDEPQPVDVPALTRALADPTTVDGLLDQGPPGVRQVLDALTWGPPVGRSPEADPRSTGKTSPARTAVEWLLRHGLLAVSDSQHVVLPREVALALRAGRTHRAPAAVPQPAATPADPATVDAGSAQAAQEVVRLVTALIALWGDEQPPVLRSGGLGLRELRRLAARLEIPESTAGLVVELAGSAGLVADDGEDPPVLAPTTEVDEWLRLPLAERWADLAQAWLVSERAAWLVGTRDDRGSLRPALDPESRRPWAPRLRTSVLSVLRDAAEAPDRAGLTAAQVTEVLRWRAPRSAPAEHAVEAVLRESAALGVLGDLVPGALSSAGAALLAGQDAAAALEAQLPPAVEHVLLQGDLTGIVPGRPSAALGELLDSSAQVESRGAGLTVRFTELSVRGALDAGRTAEELLSDLSRHARSGVPQPLEYLVLDAARRHGRVRVGGVGSYLRADDPSLLTGLVEDRTLHGLGLLRLAPTVIAAQVGPAVLLAALRERGLAPVAEGPGGQVVLTRPAPRRVRLPRGGRPAGPQATTVAATSSAADRSAAVAARERRLQRLAADLLDTDRRETASIETPDDAGPLASPDAAPAAPHPGTPDPVLALALLREAAAEGREVWLEIVGAQGASQRRRVRPLRVDAGRVRAVDSERESELTVAVHRIARVTPV